MSRLIDADALIEEYDRVHVGPPGGARKLMEDAPTIEERKTGKWIEKSTNGEMFSSCSVCGYVEWDAPRNFCPNCEQR